MVRHSSHGHVTKTRLIGAGEKVGPLLGLALWFNFFLVLTSKITTSTLDSIVMESSLSTLLSALQTSLESAGLPDKIDILTAANGISLLDLKNELFLSYLQNLVFLILIKLRHSSGNTNTEESAENTIRLNNEVTKKLAELRLYLEKGVKPLEGKLKYQIDKVVKAAEDATRSAATNGVSKIKSAKKHRRADASEDSERSSAESGEEDDAASASSSEIDELSYRPNPAALQRPSTDSARRSNADAPRDGIYRPPRITATVMPITRGKEEKAERKPNKSATLDEFIATELSTAPVAEPSIGSTIISGGRRTKTQRERDQDAEKSRYEEENLIRLPKESKKDRAKNGGGRQQGGYGGEEWRDLGAGLNRIESLVKRKEGTGGKLDRSKKRKFDGNGAGGGEMGGDFERRKKAVMRKFR